VQVGLDLKSGWIHLLPFARRDSVDRHTSNKHNKHLPWDAALRRNWRTDKKRFRYQAAFARFWQIRIWGR
jgi:hypothetical protein